MLAQRTWGYAPYRHDLSAPGDRRRFCLWAQRRGIPFEVIHHDTDVDVAVLSARADISHWSRVARGSSQLVYDLVDSYLAVSRFEPRSLVRGAAKFAIRENRRLLFDYHHGMERMCERADAVVCATEEQKEVIDRLNGNVHVILDAHGELGDAPKEDYRIRRDGELHIVWEGLPENVGQFRVIAHVLRELGRDRVVRIHLVTALAYRKYAGRFVHRSTVAEARRLLPDCRLYEWDLQTLPALATACDLAVIPLDLSDPFSRGKPANKLLSFWRMGLPTLTSATPAYRRAMDAAGVPGACATDEDWGMALKRLGDDETARRRAGTAGRNYVLQHHTDETVLLRWDAVFRSLGLP